MHSLAPRPLAALALLWLPCAAALAPAAPSFQSPEGLWRGFNPEALPLDIRVVRSWQENGLALEKLTFTGEGAGQRKVRVFALRGAPVRGRQLPGVLHIHGGGQTASLDWIKFWASRGYVCVSFDFCGPWDKRTEFTDWGPLTRATMARAGGGFPTGPDPRSASWYHWALVSRRALTLLAAHPSVDARHLGIFGVSVGGTLCWMVAGSDARVKAAVPIYGCGYNVDRRRTGTELSPETALYKRVLSPEAHAPYITCPVLFLSATNDFHGAMDNAFETLAAVPAPTRQAFTPRTNHHVAAAEGLDLPLWMDWHLKAGKPWPKSPRLKVAINRRGVPEARLQADEPANVRQVEVFYALGSRIPQARFWRRAETTRGANRWLAALPVVDVWDDLAAYASVTYASGVCLSSNLEKAIPGQLGKARATLRWTPSIDDGNSGGDHWYYPSGHTDPSITRIYLQSCPGPGKTTAFRPNRAVFGAGVSYALASHILGDPARAGRQGLQLAFTCRGRFDSGGLTVVLTQRDWQPQSVAYTAVVPSRDLAGGWRTVKLSLGHFQAKSGRRPARWEDIDRIELKGVTPKDGPPCFTDFRWLPEKPR
jgi:dienelactone hydrolase